MTHAPILRINCRRASEIRLGNRIRAGVLISNDDVKILRLLTDRDISVTFVCDGRPLYEGQVRSLLRRIVFLPDRQLWYVPTTPTGPLKPPRLPPLTTERA
jgi:hypothetical protein